MSAKAQAITPELALPGRATVMPVPPGHYVHGRPLRPPFPEGLKQLVLGMGCFWGAERRFWRLDGVYTTAVGYAGGYTPNPTYEEVCTGLTGHTEVVLVVHDPAVLSMEELLKVFWESHDPTQGMRQGNDLGTQYRSALYVPDADLLLRVTASAERYSARLAQAGRAAVTTELRMDVPFYYAEPGHQQYLAKHPDGYCGLRGTGVCYETTGCTP
jgi:peptide-methionine (S)-S-oxide reductase